MKFTYSAYKMIIGLHFGEEKYESTGELDEIEHRII